MHRHVVLPVLTMLAGVLVVPAGAAAAAPPTCDGRPATIVGTPGPDELNGTPGSDVIVGLGGSDTIDGAGGNDWICAGNGHDVVYGGAGRDRVWGGGGTDRIGGQAGDDHLAGEAGDDRLYGAGLNDTLHGGGGNDVLDSGDGHDSLHGGAGADRLYGRTGNDNLYGGWGPDRLFGGGHDDTLSGERGRDHVDGGAGKDTLHLTSPGVGVTLDLATGAFTTVDGKETEAGIENVSGTPGDDVLYGGTGPNVMSGQPFGGANQDRVYGRGGDDVLDGNQVWGGAGNDFLNGNESWGGDGRDTHIDTSGLTRASGQDGNDLFITHASSSPNAQMTAYGGPGDDRFLLRDDCAPHFPDCEQNQIRFGGGDGIDRIQVVVWEEDSGPRANEPYRFDLPARRVTNTVSGLAMPIFNVEQAVGGAGDDTLIGTGESDVLMGGDGNDTISGAGGNDVLAGGTRVFDGSPDTLDGGAGDRDRCYTSSPPSGAGPEDATQACEWFESVPVAR